MTFGFIFYYLHPATGSVSGNETVTGREIKEASFVDFDLSRKENVFELIQEIAETNQVIYVTANQTEGVPEDHILKVEENEIA